MVLFIIYDFNRAMSYWLHVHVLGPIVCNTRHGPSHCEDSNGMYNCRKCF